MEHVCVGAERQHQAYKVFVMISYQLIGVFKMSQAGTKSAGCGCSDVTCAMVLVVLREQGACSGYTRLVK